jgi:hypothetical protein
MQLGLAMDALDDFTHFEGFNQHHHYQATFFEDICHSGVRLHRLSVDIVDMRGFLVKDYFDEELV